MKLRMCVITGSATLSQNLAVRTVTVSLSCGTVTLTMTVGMTVTNLHTTVEIETVPLAGEDVLLTVITGVYLSGYSATAKMTAVTDLTNYLKTARNVRTAATSSAATTVVCRSGGPVTSRMTVATTRMRVRTCVLAGTVTAQNLSSRVRMISVYLTDGSVMVRMIVVMVLMSLIVSSMSVLLIDLNAPQVTASKRS